MRRSMLALGAAAVLGAAGFHLSLLSSLPGKDETVTAAPAHVTLTFSARVNVKLSAISILSQDSTEVAKLAVKTGPKPSIVTAEVPRRLPPGRYIVRWRTAGADGHAMRGAYAFTINPVE